MAQADDQREITRILRAVSAGHPGAHHDLIAMVREELRAIAVRRSAALPAAEMLQPTALVHEAYVRLFDRDQPPTFENRAHFFTAVATVMRDLLVEHARAKRRLKRGGGRRRVELPDAPAGDETATEILDLHESLLALEREHPREAEVVKLRFFAGLEHAEVAAILKVSEATVRRAWAFARAWLRDHFCRGDARDS